MKGYGSADGLIPETGLSETESMLLRAGNQSDVIKLAGNYKTLGIYVLHGDADKVVSVNYARQMRKVLGEFHTDMSYYEYPGGEHWFGNQSVDWKPIYDYFSWHSLPVDSSANTISFITSNPGISASFHWAAIYQQEHPLSYSNFQLTRNKKEAAISGTTSNVRLMKIQLGEWESGTPVHIRLDSSSDLTYITQGNKDSVFLLNESGKWKISGVPDVFQKGPERYGTFKDAFRNNMVLVYGTGGNAEENQWSFNKARFDAETWYYRGNGAVDIVADKNFSLEKYAGRGVIIYGNRNTNKAWEMLLADCPIQVERNKVTAGNKVWTGDSLSAYFVWPAKNSSTTSIAAITGSGIKGMKAANANQYFSGASGFPDFMVFGCDMLIKGTGGVKLAGFFDNDWKLTPAEMTEKND